MTFLQRVHYVWVRLGLFLLIAMPVVMYVTFRPWGVDASVMTTTGHVSVTVTDQAIVFAPSPPETMGLLLLPGCPVDARAYAPLARRIADRGHLAVIVKIPYRCAPLADLESVLDRRVLALAAQWPDQRWALAGHSRGAAIAAKLAALHPDRFVALVLMGTSHPRDRDLSTLPIEVTKIVATKDGVAGPAQFDTRRLPASTRWIRIEGGNHAQFGHYGFQLFDHVADISREEQQTQVAAALLAALVRLP